MSDPTGEPLLDLVRLMDRLRSPGGCPWDAEQTHESLVEYLVEEAYETVEAIETNDSLALREELGDVLLQVVFHSRIAQESADDPFTIDDVAAGIVAKLIARHPHVFGDATTLTAPQVESTWQAMKAAEKGRTSVTDGIPDGMPALLLAMKLLRRARNGGLELPPGDSHVRDAAIRSLDSVGDDHLGELLLAIVDVAGLRGLDAEAALRSAIRDHRGAIVQFEQQTVTVDERADDRDDRTR